MFVVRNDFHGILQVTALLSRIWHTVVGLAHNFGVLNPNLLYATLKCLCLHVV